METTQHSKPSAQICRLCAVQHENCVELFTNDSQEVDRLTRTICGYLGIECINDGVLPNWLCAGCQLDSEYTEKFLLLVEEAQQKLQQDSRCKHDIDENVTQNVLLAEDEANVVGSRVKSARRQATKGTFKRSLSNTRYKLRSAVTAKCVNRGTVGNKKSKTTPIEECRPKRLRRPPRRYDCNDVTADVEGKVTADVPTSVIKDSKGLNVCTLMANEPIAELRTATGNPLAEIIEVDPAVRVAHTYHSKICLICEYCKEVFAKHKELLTHLETHKNCAFECIECLQSFLVKSEFDKHQRETQHEGMGIIENILADMVEQANGSNVDAKATEFTANTAAAINIVVGNNGEITCIDSRLNTPPVMSGSIAGHVSGIDASKRPQQNVSKNHNNSQSKRIGTQFACLKCNKLFDKHYAVIRHHKQVHIGERTFKCQLCNASYKNQTNYAYHMAKHTGQRQYKCEMCPKAFILKHELTLHMRTHTGDKPYKCVHCSKAFAHRSNLLVHLRLHTGQRPFQCEMCCATFNSSSHYKSHKAKHHKLTAAENHVTQQPHVKRRTKADSAQQEYLKIAVNLKANTATSAVANKMNSCADHTAPVCRSLLKQNVHKITASEIGQSYRSFMSHVRLLSHAQITNALNSTKERDAAQQAILPTASVGDAYRYQCTYCMKLFRVKSALTKHLRTHTGEKPYRCPHCPRSFADPSNLKKHKKQHKSATEQLQSVSTKLSNANLKQQLHQKQYSVQKAYKTVTLASPGRSDTAASDPDPDGLEVVEHIVAPSLNDAIGGDDHFSRGTKMPALCAEGLVCISYQDPENPNDRTTRKFFLPN